VVEALDHFGPHIPHMWRSLETHVNFDLKVAEMELCLDRSFGD
jgi:hypothetical protein